MNERSHLGESELLCASIFCSHGPVGAGLVNAWLDRGHSVSVVVVGHFDPLGLERWRHLAERGVVVIGAPYPADWARILRALHVHARQPDVLLSYSFMQKIPRFMLQKHRFGGINFHPSLLPHYRGSNPVRAMIADRALHEYGGVSAHVMTQRFDAGDLIAQVPMAPAEYRSVARCLETVGAIVAHLATEIVPEFCAGMIEPRAQASGGSESSASPKTLTLVADEWSLNEIQAAFAFLRPKTELRVQLASHRGTIPVHALRNRRSGSTGKPPRIGLLAVDLDCADGRVSLFRDNWPGRVAGRIAGWRRR